MILIPSVVGTHLLSRPSAQTLEVRIIPQVMSTFVDQLLLVFSWWYIPWNHKIHNIRILGCGVRYLHEHVISEEVIYR